MTNPIGQKPTLIIVDSDAEACKAVTAALSKCEFQIYACGDAKQAIRYVERQPARWQPGMFMIDLVLPEISGFELLRRLTEKYNPKVVPFIMMSKHQSHEDTIEAQQGGAVGVLKKPVTLDLFNKLLEEAQSRQQLSLERDEKSGGYIVRASHD